MTFDQLKTAVSDHAGVAADDTTVGQWVNDAYRSMVARAHWLVKEVDIGDTVAGQERYSISDDIVDLEELLVGEDPYLLVSTREMYKLKSGRNRLPYDWSGAFAGVFEEDGTEAVELFPAPDAGGAQITALASVKPPDLTGSQSPLVPEEFHEFIRDGAVATGLKLIDERHDSAVPFEQRYEQGVAMLGRRKHSRIGAGPVQFRVKGAHW